MYSNFTIEFGETLSSVLKAAPNVSFKVYAPELNSIDEASKYFQIHIRILGVIIVVGTSQWITHGCPTFRDESVAKSCRFSTSGPAFI